MTTYRTTNGERIAKSLIDAKVREAKARKLEMFFDEHGYYFCENCGTSSGRIDCSHTISVDRCQKHGKSELAWHIGNIRLLCRKCHQEHDKLK